MAQDDYYYEIQLTNKQLVFYFMAGAAGLILSFLAGVMVGRGVDSSAGEVRAARPLAEERVVAEESPAARPAPPPAEELTYAQRLEGDKVDDSLRPANVSASAASPGVKPSSAQMKGGTAAESSRTSAAVTEPAKAPTSAPAKNVPPKPSPAAKVAAPKPASGPSAVASFTIQVGAFKDKITADSVVERLKEKGFAAYVVTPEGSDALYNVRVGSYPARADAERVQTRLRDEEKYKPFIVKN